MQTYMVIECFKDGCIDEIYARFEERGRMLPDGLFFVNSWRSLERGICYQVMRAEDPALFEVWTGQWDDLVDFEIVPVE